MSTLAVCQSATTNTNLERVSNSNSLMIRHHTEEEEEEEEQREEDDYSLDMSGSRRRSDLDWKRLFFFIFQILLIRVQWKNCNKSGQPLLPVTTTQTKPPPTTSSVPHRPMEQSRKDTLKALSKAKHTVFSSLLAILCGLLSLNLGSNTTPSPTTATRFLIISCNFTILVGIGANVMLGGRRHNLGMTFYEPTVFSNVKSEMLISREEVSGPVAPLMLFKSEEEAIHMANDTNAGLAAYIFTKSISRSWRVSDALEYGLVGVNEGQISTEVAPFGGYKQSGIGREAQVCVHGGLGVLI